MARGKEIDKCEFSTVEMRQHLKDNPGLPEKERKKIQKMIDKAETENKRLLNAMETTKTMRISRIQLLREGKGVPLKIEKYTLLQVDLLESLLKLSEIVARAEKKKIKLENYKELE